MEISDPVEALILDLLEWIGPEARPYREVMDAWRTSCPRLPVWEDANERGLLAYHGSGGTGVMVSVSALGAKYLAERRHIVSEPHRDEPPGRNDHAPAQAALSGTQRPRGRP